MRASLNAQQLKWKGNGSIEPHWVLLPSEQEPEVVVGKGLTKVESRRLEKCGL